MTNEPTETAPTPLEALQAAVQVFVNATAEDGPVLLQSAVLAFEAVRFDDDGDMMHRIRYATVQGSVSSSAGLLSLAETSLKEDLGFFGDHSSDEP